MRDLKYTNFYKLYRHVTNPKIRVHNHSLYHRIYIDGVQKEVYIKQREESSDVIVRMEMIYPSAGEIWYLRVLLLNKAFVSYEDARTCNGITYPTFQLSALAYEFINSHNETQLCFQEALLLSSPPELRFLFAILTMQGFPTLSIYEDQECWEALTLDYRHDIRLLQSREAINNYLLLDLHKLFVENHCSLRDYSLPEPQEYPTELAIERLKYNAEEQLVVLNELNINSPNNEDQEQLFQTIKLSIDLNETCKYFIQGQAGCGKTTLAKKILAYTRSQNYVALGCASTGLATTIYEDFHTAHDLFCYPVVEDGAEDESNQPECEISKHPDRAELIQHAKVIIWDEMVSNHREIYEAAHRVTNGFKGKIIIGMGDWRQTLPIVKYGETQEILSACLKRSLLWNEFTVLNLNINMRLSQIQKRIDSNIISFGDTYLSSREYSSDLEQLRQQNKYGSLILAIGDGVDYHLDCDQVYKEKKQGLLMYRLTALPFFQLTEIGMRDGLQWLYPQGFSNDPDFVSSAILAATNQQVDQWNSIVQDMNPSQLFELKSKDSLCEVDDPHGHIERMLSNTVLNNFQHVSAPSHQLLLKVGDICLITRNLSKAYGLANNTRVKLLHISQSSIRVQTLGSSPKSAMVPRIYFKFRIKFQESYQMMRLQFPLRLAYSMTYNKCQGQTMKKVLLDISNPPFAHGHLYVALSRVTNYQDIKIICKDDQLLENSPVINNVTYPEIIE
jgi:energy-coupling factor transporter ATP-binding protein EcfA2